MYYVAEERYVFTDESTTRHLLFPVFEPIVISNNDI